MKYLLSILLASICFAELPPISQLSTKERILVAELSRDIIPDPNLVIAKLQALERSDFNHDGTVDLQDFAVFAGDYGLFVMEQPVIIVKEPEPLKIYADFNDVNFMNYYLNEYMEN